MRRSEAIQTIKDALYAHLPGYAECPDFIAETVLQSLEGLGMRPPVRNEKVTQSEIVASGYAPIEFLERQWDK